MSAGYDRTQISIPDGPGLNLTLSLRTAWATDYIKPGPAIRAYMTPLGPSAPHKPVACSFLRWL